MKLTKKLISTLIKSRAFYKNLTLVLTVVFLGAPVFFALWGTSAQTYEKGGNLPATPFRIGEKLTYTLSFGNFKNVGSAELYAMSRGKLNDRDAVELYSKFKTNELVSAAFYLLDETRTTFAAADSGLPIYVRKTSNAGVSPMETVTNYLNAPTQNYDLLTLIYKLRNAGGVGSFLLQEDDKVYTLTAQPTEGEKMVKIKTDAGEYDTVVSTIQSDYFSQKGIKDFRIYFSANEQKIPIGLIFKIKKVEFQAVLASVQIVEPEATPTPTPTPTPIPVLTPTPVPMPTPSLDNLPLSANLPFVLGETLEYGITSNGRYVGTLVLQARERRTIDKRDVLFLTATITRAEGGLGLFNPGDSITAQVNAESLAPFQFEVKFSGSLRTSNQSVRFDQDRGVAVAGANQAQIPVNTHSLLSLAYAMRSFTLKRIWDTKNPIMDTRVSVFYNSKNYVFTLRPLDAEILIVGKEKVPAQVVRIITEDPQLDALNLRVWLSGNEKRTPLRFAVGNYQADLISESVVLPK